MNNLGLHVIGDAFDPAGLVSDTGARPCVVKLVEPSLAFKRAVREAVGPDCLIIIRFYEREQPLSAPRANARQWYMNHVAAMLAMTDPNVAFEGYNEIPDADAERYAEFEFERMALLQRAGFRAVVGNWSVGTPDLPTWQTYKPLLDMLKPGDLVGLHEYWGNVRHLADAATPEGGWYCGRFKKVAELRPFVERGQVVITECGRDAVEGAPAGWKRAVDAGTYVRELAQYAAAIAPLRAVVFTAGNAPGWEMFNVGDIWQEVTEMYTTTTVAPPPVKDKYRLRPWLRRWDRWQTTRPFGYKDPSYADGWHKGADMVRNDGGTHGAVILCPFERAIVDIVSWREDRGWYLYLYDEAQGIEFFVCHLALEPCVEEGQTVTRGQAVGYVGNTGRLTTGPHLHVGICEVDTWLNILRWLDPFGSEVEISEEV